MNMKENKDLSPEESERQFRERFLNSYFSLILNTAEGLGRRGKLSLDEKEKLYRKLRKTLTEDIARVSS